MIYKRFTSGDISSCTYILGCPETRQAVMIDPGYTKEEADVFLEEENLTLLYIVNTHGHADHIHNNRYFKERYQAQILVGTADAPCLTDPVRNLSRYLGYELESPPADRMLREGETVSAGTLTLQVMETPGHTPGSITLKAGDSVFVGDLVFNGSVGRTDLPGGDTEQLLDTLRRRILPLPDGTRIYSGHGFYTTTIGEQKKVNPYFRELMEENHE